MTSTARSNALEVLAEVSEMAPEVRLGQLFEHLGFLGEAHLGRRLSDLEDDELVTILRRHCDELSTRFPNSSTSASQPVDLSVSFATTTTH